MAWVFGGKHFGQYTYEHWFDDEYDYSKDRKEAGVRAEASPLILLAHYNKSVNLRMNKIIEKLNRTEWEKPLGGFFPSVRSLCSHLYIADFNWLKRFGNLRAFTSLGDPFFDRTLSVDEALFPETDEYLAQRPALDERIIACAAEFSKADLSAILKYTDSRGDSHEKNFGGCAFHFFAHGIHHRGMISLYLEMLGYPNDFASLAQLL